MKLLLYPLALAVGLLLQACGGGGGGAAPPADAPAPPASCSVQEQRQSLRDYLDQEYFWYAQLRTPDSGAGTLDSYFHSMLNKPQDRYSFSQPTETYQQVFTSGRRTGFGYTLVWGDDAHTALRVRNVEQFGPAAIAGLRRGDTIVSIDGFTPEQIVAGQLPAVTTPGVSRTFVIRAGQEERRIQAVSAVHELSPIAATAIFDAFRDGAPMKVGYLAYHQFVGYNLWELALILQRFADAGVSEMILDLRYNGGGSVTVSRDLASMVSGSRTDGHVYANLRYSERQAARNTQIPFSTAQTRFTRPIEGLARVLVITSGATASASELLINGLRPFMPVVLVGETTYGKPYGFLPRNACGITYNAVQFEAANVLGSADFAGGFTPTCQVPDDLDRALGDPAEGRLRAALDYVATGRCAAQPPQSFGADRARSRAQAFGDTTPSQMFLE